LIILLKSSFPKNKYSKQIDSSNYENKYSKQIDSSNYENKYSKKIKNFKKKKKIRVCQIHEKKLVSDMVDLIKIIFHYLQKIF
jgi:hypothetical protein